MSRAPVEAVLINWKRGGNVVKIVEALREQSVACTVTICDCHPSGEFALPDTTLRQADRVYRWTHNLGGYNRYAPIGGYDHEYTFFLDDDLLPGSRCVEHFLDHVPVRPFGVLGQVGRRLKPDMVYRPRDVARGTSLEEVDLIVQAYFVRTRHLAHVVRARWDLLPHGDLMGEDDVVLAVGMGRAGLGCYLTPRSDDPQTSITLEPMPEPYAICQRNDHLDRRTALLAAAHRQGWRSLGERRQTPLIWALRRRLFVVERRFRDLRRRRAL